jgi:uncharacterized protein
MSIVTTKKIVDFALDIIPLGQDLKFGFSGGEPLLYIDLIKNTINYIHEKQQTKKNPISFNITTNGTLLTKPILDYIRREHIDLCISIDGSAPVYNLNRRYKNGRICYNKVVKNLQLALERLNKLQVNAVYGPDTIDHLAKSVSYFTDLGISAIHLNPNIHAFNGNKIASKLRKTYMQIADHYIQCYQNDTEIAINLIDSKIIVFLKGGYDATDKCGMGETEWGFAPSGNIYPCERLIGEDNDLSLCLGNIHTGFDFSNQNSLLKPKNNRNKKCNNCIYQKFCMNWCGCSNYHMTGHTNLVSDTFCESEKAAILAAKFVLTTLNQNELFLDHFMKYLQKGHHENIMEVI